MSETWIDDIKESCRVFLKPYEPYSELYRGFTITVRPRPGCFTKSKEDLLSELRADIDERIASEAREGRDVKADDRS
jgi:hypothetical protein